MKSADFSFGRSFKENTCLFVKGLNDEILYDIKWLNIFSRVSSRQSHR
jgi:hypothetical protein